MKIKSRYNRARKILIFWTLFIGIGAVAGAAGMLIDPSGKAMKMNAMLPYFKKLPFSDILFKDFTFSGISLLIVNGITNLTAAVLLIKNKRTGIILGCVFGITLMLWICIQFYMFPLNFMSTAYFIFGLCQAVTGYAAYVFYTQESFKINISDYKNIGKNPDTLVVYFSRMGYVKKSALEAADRLGADICEIEAKERTEGTLGFWWCGRFGMHKWAMPTKDLKADLTKYRHITICSPVWVFNLCAPVRDFIKKYSGKIKEADLILLHYNPSVYENAKEEVEKELKIKLTGFKSIQCKKGVVKTVYERAY